ALPILGDVTPRDLPPSFLPFMSRAMMLRPMQIRANAEDAAFMIAQAKVSSERHHALQMPVEILAVQKDLLVDMEAHSARLHADVPQSMLVVVPGTGHTGHYA